MSRPPATSPASPPRARVGPRTGLLDREQPVPPLFREGDAWRLPLVLVATLLLFLPALRAGFVYDDLLMVERNPSIRGLASIPALFSNSYWDFLGPREALRIGYWRPLTATALTLAQAAGGGAPFAFHLLSVLVHLLATAVCFRLLQRLARSTPAAFWGALLFGLHPVHVESVAWVTALNDPLFGLFALLALNSFAAWRERGSPGVPWAAAAWFGLSLLAKELAASVLPLAFLLDACRARESEDGTLRNGLRPFVRAWAPFAVVLVAIWLWRWSVFGSAWAGLDRQTTDFGVGLGRLAVLRAELVGGGTWLIAWPRHLSLFHLFQPEFAADDPTPWAAVGITALLLLGAAAAWRRRLGLALFALLTIPAGLLPALLRPASLGMFPLSERFLYLPVLGVALLAPWLAYRFLPRAGATLLLLLLVGGMAWRSTERIPVWNSEETLWRASAAEAPGSPYVQWGLGRVLLGVYGAEGDPAVLHEAYDAFRLAQDLARAGRHGDNRVYTTAMDSLQSNLGVGWCELYIAELEGTGEFTTPIEVFRQISDAFPASEDAFTGLGSARLRGGDLDGAIEAFQGALRINARSVPAHVNLGRALFQADQLDLARGHLEYALELEPGHEGARLALAQVAYADGDLHRARELAEEVRERFPDSPEAATLLGSLAASRRDWPGALAWLDRALRADPDHGPAHLAKAKVLFALDDTGGAIASFRRATEAMPSDFEAHYNLGALLERSGAVDAALPYLERAYEVGSDEGLLITVRKALALLAPEDLGLALRAARTDLSRGSSSAATLWAERALALAPNSPDALLVRAQLHAAEGELEAAVEVYRKLLAIGGSSFTTHSDLGFALGTLGRREEALEQLERALAIGPPEGLVEEFRQLAIQRVERRIEELKE